MANAVSNTQSSLALTEAVVNYGEFPSQDGGSSSGDYLGMIATYAFDFAPGGTEDASGASLSIQSETALFSLLGINFGGNGTTIFKLPDLAGVTAIGAGYGAGLPPDSIGDLVGSASTTLTTAELPSQYGGTSASFSNYQPSLAITYAIAINGVFPTQGGSGAAHTNILGAVDAFAGNFAPGGFLACDGQLLPIVQYVALFNVIGTTYGGNGTSTFALPNLQGRTIVGVSASDPLGADLGTANVDLTNAEMPTPRTSPQAVDNVEPSLAMNYLIALDGIYPQRDGGEPDSSDAVVGQIQAFAGYYAPSGWALCDGQLLSISEFTALFSLIGTYYGGNGVTTFALPDLEGSTIIGTGGSDTIGQLIGENETTLVAADIPTAVVTWETSNSPEGIDVGAGSTITFSLTLNENVTVTEGGAAPVLQLNDGELAVYSGPVGVAVDALTFSYTVAAGDNVADLQATAFPALAAGTTIDNEAGTAANLSGFSTIDTGVEVDTTPPTVTVAQFLVKQSTLDTLTSGFAVSDTAANIAAYLTASVPDGQSALALDASHITEITASGGTVTVGNGVFAADQAALDKIVGGFAISGKASVLDGNLAGLESDQANIDSVTATGGAITATIAEFEADEPMLNKVSGGFAISDTAADIAAYLTASVPDGQSALALDASHITAITASGGTVTVGNGVFAADQAALDRIVGGFAISGKAGVLDGNLAGLESDQANIDSVTATGGAITATIAEFEADEPMLNKVSGGFAISDTAADISAYLTGTVPTALAADASHITAITATGGTVTIGNGAFAADQAALDKIVGGFAISGKASVLDGNLDGLENDIGAITSITGAGGVITGTMASFGRDETALNKVVGGFDISDTAANVVAGLSLLQGDLGDLDAITLTDAAEPTLTLTAAQKAADQGVLAKITSPYALNVV